jgi:uncharacterized protein
MAAIESTEPTQPQSPAGPQSPGQPQSPAQPQTQPQEPTQPPPGYSAPPPAAETAVGALAPPQGARDVAMWTHLSALIGLVGIPSAVGPLVVWLAKRESHPFANDQGKEALNFNISALIYAFGIGLVGTFFSVITLGLGLFLFIPLFAAVVVAWIVFVIIAAVRSSKGEAYRYPLTIRMVN